jgi:hypothetical protein
VLSSLWNARTWIQLLALLVTAPFWWPIARVLWAELQEALAPEGGLFGLRPRRAVARRPRGLDPFESLPWAIGRPGHTAPSEPDALIPVRRRGF